MNNKELGIKFTETKNGFRIEVSGDEELVSAHREMADAWKEFIHTIHKVGKAHSKHFGHHWHHGSMCEDETVVNVTKE